MLTLHLVRHGQTNFNAEGRVQGQFDSVLTEVGIAQAEQLRPKIKALGLTAVYASSNVRAKHTAEIITEGIPLEIECRDDLREIFMGPWQHRLWKEVAETDEEQFTFFMSQPDRFFTDGAERFEEVQSRGVAAIEEIISAEEQGSVLVVSHGAILKTIIAHYADVPLGEMWTEPHLLNCSHSILEVNPGGERSVITVSGESVAGTVWES